MSQEQDRIDFLLDRDGHAETRKWVVRTMEMYRDAIDTPSSHASLPEYRPRFEQAIAEFQAWLQAQRGMPGG